MITQLGVHVSMVEIKHDKAMMLSELLPDVNVICGDGTDQELLEQEGLSQMDAFIALCDRDEENLIAGLYAVKKGVPKVVVKNNRVSYVDIINEMGLDSIVSPKAITCASILRYVRARVNGEGTKVERLYRLMNGKAEALEFRVTDGAACIGIPLKSLKLKPNVLVCAVIRGDRSIIPDGETTICAGDHAIIVSSVGKLKTIDGIVDK